MRYEFKIVDACGLITFKVRYCIDPVSNEWDEYTTRALDSAEAEANFDVWAEEHGIVWYSRYADAVVNDQNNQ